MSAAIPRDRHAQLKYFERRSNYERFHQFLASARFCPHEEVCELLHTKIYDWLVEMEEPRAAEWYRRHWSGEFGRWMLGYAEDPPFTITDNSNEAWFRWLKKNLRSMTGGTGANTSAMMSRLFERINMQSRQQVHDLREEWNSAMPHPRRKEIGRAHV